MATKKTAKGSRQGVATLFPDSHAPAPVARSEGRRFSRRQVHEHDLRADSDGEALGSVVLQRLHADEHTLDTARHKATALRVLSAAGIDAAAFLVDHPGGSALRTKVLNDLGHAPDSAVGLAARICELCIRLETLPNLGARPKDLVREAFMLGRLVVLADVYALEDQRMAQIQAAGAAERRQHTDAEKDGWRVMYREHFAEHSARRAAQLIVQRLGLPADKEETVRKALGNKAGKPG